MDFFMGIAEQEYCNEWGNRGDYAYWKHYELIFSLLEDWRIFLAQKRNLVLSRKKMEYQFKEKVERGCTWKVTGEAISWRNTWKKTFSPSSTEFWPHILSGDDMVCMKTVWRVKKWKRATIQVPKEHKCSSCVEMQLIKISMTLKCHLWLGM